MADAAGGVLRARRRWVAGFVAIMLVGATAVACSSDSSSSGGGSGGEPESARPEPVGEQVDLSADGFHEIPPPLFAEDPPFQEYEVRAWTGSELLVWGGQSNVGDSTPSRIVGTGAALSLDDGRWTPMPPSPYPDGLYRPLGAWDGTELIVIGTLCELDIPSATDGSPPPCPDGPRAMAFDPASWTWRKLANPPIPLDQDYGEAIISRGQSVGGGGQALFAFGWTGEAIGWDRADGSWTTVGPAGDERTNMETCVDSMMAQVLAITVRDPGTRTQAEVRTLDLGATAWSDPRTLDISLDWGVTCSDGNVLSSEFDRDANSAELIDVETGSVTSIYDEVEPRTLRNAWLVGPWIFSSSSIWDPATPEEELTGNYLEARLAAGGDWDRLEEVEVADGISFDAIRLSQIYVPDVGVVAGQGFFTLLWRAPDTLQP